MLTNIKKLSTLFVALVLVLVPLFVSQVAAASLEIPMTTFTISKLGDLTLVDRDGVPQTIVVRGRDLSGSNVGISVNRKLFTGDVMLSNNLTLLPGTMPLMFDHHGMLKFTVGDDMFVMQFMGTATRSEDLVMNTMTLNSSGDFVFTEGTGVFAGLKGMNGTYKLNQICQIAAGGQPKVGAPVEVTLSDS